MVKLTEFSITFPGNRVVFYPGETVSGNLVMSLQQEMQMRGIKIKVQGKSHCHWKETKGSGDNRRTVHYNGNEELFDIKLWVHGNGANKFKQEAGRFFFPFSFMLPPVLPSSFEGSIGYIRYHICAEIDKPWKFNYKTKMPFTINEVIDPNRPEYATVRPGGQKENEVGCCCCAAGNVVMNANIDRAAYCPGENILITSHIDNQTTRDMECLKGKLYKIVEYHANTKTKTKKDKIAEIIGPAIPRGEFAKWDNQPLQIPATNPTITNSRVIKVYYQFKIEVAVPWGIDPDITVPVVVGSVPFRAPQPPPLVQYAQPGPAQYPPAGPLQYPHPGAQHPPPDQPQYPPPGQQYPPPGQQYPPPGQYPPAKQDPGMGYPPSGPGMYPPQAPNQPPTYGGGFPDMPPPSYAAAMGAEVTNIADDDDTAHTFGTLNYTPVYAFAQPSAPPMQPPAEGVVNQQPPPYNALAHENTPLVPPK